MLSKVWYKAEVSTAKWRPWHLNQGKHSRLRKKQCWVNKLGWVHLNPSCGDSGVALEPCFSESGQQEQHLELVKNPGLAKSCFSKPELHAQHLGLVKIAASLVSPRTSASYKMPSKVGRSFLGCMKAKFSLQVSPCCEKEAESELDVWGKGWRLRLGKPATCPLSVKSAGFLGVVGSHLEGGTCCFLMLASVFAGCPLVLADPACLCISSR